MAPTPAAPRLPRLPLRTRFGAPTARIGTTLPPTSSWGGRVAQVIVALAGVVVLLVGGASPAAADAAGPSDFRSEVRGIEPAVEGVTATIRGGDSFLEVSAAPGHTVVVEGYQGEPYLQVLEDGTVQRNRLSSATYLNDDRNGGGTVPPEVTAAMADEGTTPEWETIAEGGTYAWHDHRVHWMGAAPRVPRGESLGSGFDPWRVPIVVDGEPADIVGVLTYEPAPSPLPWVGLAVVVAGVGIWLGRGRSDARLPAALLVAVAAVALLVGRAEWAATPGGGNPLHWALPVAALVAGLVALAIAGRSAGAIASLVAVAALSGWSLFRVQVLLKPVLPTELPFVLDRATVAVALGASVAVAYLVVTSGALALPALEPDE